jgi:hypothetical protein
MSFLLQAPFQLGCARASTLSALVDGRCQPRGD